MKKKKQFVYRTSEELVENTAQYLAAASKGAITHHGAFHIALSGGSTPKRLYEYLAIKGAKLGLNWSKTHIYFSDERCVPPDHSDSNYKMAREAANLISKNHCDAVTFFFACLQVNKT